MKRMMTALTVLVFALALGAPMALADDYGKCSFNSDCHAGVKCNSSRCADSAGSKCSFDSDCGGNGAKCNSGKCSNAPDGSHRCRLRFRVTRHQQNRHQQDQDRAHIHLRDQKVSSRPAWRMW